MLTAAIRIMRQIHRAAISFTMLLWLVVLTFTAIRLTLLHTRAIGPSCIVTITVSRCIHRATFPAIRLTKIVRPSTIVTTSVAILLRIRLTTLAITLRFSALRFATLRIRWNTIPFTLDFNLRAALRGGRHVRFGYFRGRFVGGLRFLGL